ncbi:putative SAM-dependent methyltransferase [Borreliella afzelii]|uniref:SAM-dependent methyltransferase n=2 Tax=Borreliella afzelii TaxID=29518 RepID=A0AB34Z4Q1_BORAF|nr:putative SAM-dependent methyltransferase [Borreliella afzelii]
MRYKMKILTKNKTYEYPPRVLSVYEWDKVLEFINQSDAVSKLNKVKYLREITSLMISPKFLDEFYVIFLDANREFISYYKDYLVPIIYTMQFNTFYIDNDLKTPALVYLSEYENNVGDFVTFDYINDNFDYTKVTTLLTSNSNELVAK